MSGVIEGFSEDANLLAKIHKFFDRWERSPTVIVSSSESLSVKLFAPDAMNKIISLLSGALTSFEDGLQLQQCRAFSKALSLAS
ncbi:hypothetical protein LP416_01300 [Polaromonas sp. P2-4]|nr:hypothetical protein LP416_01300 [Polaromonas sp. P2-4]